VFKLILPPRWLLLLLQVPDARLGGSLWECFSAADWLDFDDIEELFQQVQMAV
jgi:hypothetical protein